VQTITLGGGCSAIPVGARTNACYLTFNGFDALGDERARRRTSAAPVLIPLGYHLHSGHQIKWASSVAGNAVLNVLQLSWDLRRPSRARCIFLALRGEPRCGIWSRSTSEFSPTEGPAFLAAGERSHAPAPPSQQGFFARLTGSCRWVQCRYGAERRF
jgi:hypothetical protein